MADAHEVRNPSSEDRREIEATLRLSGAAATLLWTEVDRVVDEIQEHKHMSQQRAQGRNRQKTNGYLGTLSKQLDKLNKHLTKLDPNTAPILRRLLSGPLGELISHRGFAMLLNVSLSYDVSSHTQNSREWTSRGGPGRAIEAELASRRTAVAADHTPELLDNLFIELRRPILRHLEIERSNRGGRLRRSTATMSSDVLPPFMRRSGTRGQGQRRKGSS